MKALFKRIQLTPWRARAGGVSVYVRSCWRLRSVSVVSTERI